MSFARSRVNVGSVGLGLVLACSAAAACSAPAEPDGVPDFQAPPAAGAMGVPNGAAPQTPGAAPASPAAASPAPGEPAQGDGAPIAPSAPAAGNAPGSAAPAAPAAPAADMGGAPMPPAAAEPGAPAAPAAPAPSAPAAPTAQPAPGAAFFFDDFEASAIGEAPANWDYFVAWVANQNNPSGNASALVDDTRAFTGTRSVRFSGGQNPAQITLPLPAGTSRLYVRAMVFISRQLGNNGADSNHDTLIGIRGTPGQASDEIRFGEIKGAIGTNEVPSDNISPRQDQWNQGPSVAPNEWHCFQVEFLGDLPQNELHAYVDGQLVHEVTAPDQWNNGDLPGDWMAGKFSEVVLGWHSFSGFEADVWMDDIALGTSPIGCE